MFGFIKKYFLYYWLAWLIPLTTQNLYTYVIKNVKFNLLLLIYIPLLLIYNEYINELHCYPFAVKLGRCGGSRNTINELTKKVFQIKTKQKKLEDLNMHIFNMITGKIESKILTKDILCECKCKFDGRKCNSNYKWNNNKCWCELKNIIYVKKIILGILVHVVVQW